MKLTKPPECPQSGPGDGGPDDEDAERVGRDKDHPAQHDRGGAGARREAGRPRVQERQPLASVKDILQDGEEDKLLLRELELIWRKTPRRLF